MERRQFLGTLLASLGALTIDPASLLWHPPADSLALPVVTPEALLTMEAITRACARRLANRWQGQTIVDASRLGESRLTRQFNVTVPAYVPSEVHREGLDPELYLQPSAEALARKLQDFHVRVCGRLPHLELPGVSSARVDIPDAGLSLRGVMQYDITYDAHLMRFDVVCG